MRSRTPLGVTALGAVAVALLGLPLVALVVRAPWSRLPGELGSEATRTALWLSLRTSFTALGVTVLLGVPLAVVLARVDFPGRAVVRALVTLPLVLPPVVGGVALLLAFGRRGLLGGPLARLGVSLPFTTAGAVVAEAFVALPFLVVAVEGALRSLDARHEDVAASLGASPTRVLRTVTLPLVAPGLAAGMALAWARALGEFGATITFAGSFPGRTQTLPLAVYLALLDDPAAAEVLSLLLLAVSVAVLVVLRGRWAGARP